MTEYYNNAFFWQKVDTLFHSSSVKITKKKGDHHDEFHNLVYPMKYLTDTKGSNGNGISVYVGSGSSKVSALVVACDILMKELDVKMLIGCSEEEIEEVLRFLNQTEFQKTVLIKRGSSVPPWAESDN